MWEFWWTFRGSANRRPVVWALFDAVGEAGGGRNMLVLCFQTSDIFVLFRRCSCCWGFTNYFIWVGRVRTVKARNLSKKKIMLPENRSAFSTSTAKCPKKFRLFLNEMFSQQLVSSWLGNAACHWHHRNSFPFTKIYFLFAVKQHSNIWRFARLILLCFNVV